MIKVLVFFMVFFGMVSSEINAKGSKYDMVVTTLIKEVHLSGIELKVLNVAFLELKKKQLNIENYKVVLSKSGSGYLVIFEDPATSGDQLGSSSMMPTLEVDVDENYMVRKVNFSR